MIEKIDFPTEKKGLFDEIYSTQKTWEFQEGVGVPHLVIIPVYGIIRGLKQFYPNVNAKACFTAARSGGSSMLWIHDVSLVNQPRHMIDDDSIENIYKVWQPYKERFYSAIDNFDQNTPLKDYEKYYQIYLTAYSPALATEWFTSIFSDEVISSITKQKPRYKQEANILTKPPKLVFLVHEKLELYKLALTDFSQNDILAHRQKWHWVNYNYRDTDMPNINYYFENLQKIKQIPREEIKHEISKIKNYEQDHREKVEEIKKSQIFTDKESNRLTKIGFVGWMQDERKQLNLIGNWLMNAFLKKASQKFNIDFKLLQYTTPAEFIDLINTGKINADELKQRFKATITVYNEGNYEEIISGQKALDKIPLLENLRVADNVDMLKGTPASPGLAKGTVRIVTDPSREGKEFIKGEVLVTSMTRPDMVPIMHLASAIITNEGGLTSHAAIISREMGIPCIIGTKVATKIVNDGDTVEVDANNGVMRIIKRKTGSPPK